MDVCAVANWSTRAELAVAHYYPSASSALKSLKFKFSMGLKIIYMAMGASVGTNLMVWVQVWANKKKQPNTHTQIY